MFYHVTLIGRYQEITDKILSRVYSSNAIHHLENIFITTLGEGTLNISPDEKIKIIYNGKKDEWEHPSMLAIREFALTHPDYNILYTQSAGVSHPPTPYLEDRMEYLLYFNIELYASAIEHLKQHDTYGVDFSNIPTPHYSGNFWWATSNYLKTLPKVTDLPMTFGPITSDRHRSEFWVCYPRTGKYYSAYDSGISVYEKHLHRLPPDKYKL
jgi:hypothetical protein